MRKILLVLYYAVFSRLPMEEFPGGKFFNRLRAMAARRILPHFGQRTRLSSGCYFGDGHRLRIGSDCTIAQNVRLNGTITIGNDCLIAPDVVMMSTTHNHTRTDIPIARQGSGEEQPIVIEDGVWVGTRVVILPGVTIGHDSIVATGAVVSRSCEPFSIIGGVPAKFVKSRKEPEN